MRSCFSLADFMQVLLCSALLNRREIPFMKIRPQALVVLVVAMVACAQSPDPEPVSSELTSSQCIYFDANGKDLICHATGSASHPYTIVKVADNACENAHAAHAGDYITSADPTSPLYDPTCGGGGCLPKGAPCDATVPCCDGLTCTAGTCVAVAVVAAPPGDCPAAPACTTTPCPPPPPCGGAAGAVPAAP